MWMVYRILSAKYMSQCWQWCNNCGSWTWTGRVGVLGWLFVMQGELIWALRSLFGPATGLKFLWLCTGCLSGLALDELCATLETTVVIVGAIHCCITNGFSSLQVAISEDAGVWTSCARLESWPAKADSRFNGLSTMSCTSFDMPLICAFPRAS